MISTRPLAELPAQPSAGILLDESELESSATCCTSDTAARPSQARQDPSSGIPDPSCDLEANVESQRGLVSDFRIVPICGSPELNHQSHRILHDKRATDVEEVQSRIGPARQFRREILGQDRITEDSSSADRRHHVLPCGLTMSLRFGFT